MCSKNTVFKETFRESYWRFKLHLLGGHCTVITMRAYLNNKVQTSGKCQVAGESCAHDLHSSSYPTPSMIGWKEITWNIGCISYCLDHVRKWIKIRQCRLKPTTNISITKWSYHFKCLSEQETNRIICEQGLILCWPIHPLTTRFSGSVSHSHAPERINSLNCN